MKQLYFKMFMLAWGLTLSITTHAQDEPSSSADLLTITYTLNGSEVTTTCQEGKLMEALGGEEFAMQVTKIKIEGALITDDVKTLRLMAGSNESDESTGKGALREIDFSKTTFKSTEWNQDIPQEERTDDNDPNTFLKTSKQNNLIDDNRDGDGNLVYQYGKVINSDDNLPPYIFSNCDNLVKVTLHENTTTVGAVAFRGCDNLQECTNLVSANTTITEIGAGAFAYCKRINLTDGNGLLPQNLQSIANGAFSHCYLDNNTGLSKLTIPESVIIIDMGAFANCMALKELYFAGDLQETDPSVVKELSILNNAFADCQNMVIQDGGQLPNRIVNISDLGFAHNLSPVIILPKNPKLTGAPHTIDINGVATEDRGNVGFGAFGWCEKGLQKVIIPENITHLQPNVFVSAFHLTELEFEAPENIIFIGGAAFASDKLLADKFTGVTNVETIGEGAFRDCAMLTDADANALITQSKVTRIENVTYSGCTSLTKIDLNKNISYIGENAFSGDKALTQLIVHRGERIDAYTYKYNRHEERDEHNTLVREWWQYDDMSPFHDINANQVEVIFEGDAETHYQQVYRDNIDNNWMITYDGEQHVERKGNAFMTLLTKTLIDTDEDYTVVPQRHADVKLYRTFTEGWNTLALPFGAQAADYKGDIKGAAIFKNALNTTGNSNAFMMATYRGLWLKEETDNSMFYFLKVSEPSQPLDDFEPILVRMDAEDIAQAKAASDINEQQLYTFENVELNYEENADQSYTAHQPADMEIAMKQFDGNEDHTLNNKFSHCQYDQFLFCGTLYKRSGSDFITTGDYIIQKNNFVKCLDGKSYGLKGFRGFFKKQSTSSEAKGDLINLSVVDEKGSTTTITHLDGEALPTTGIIHNLNGQQMNSHASTLPKGIYIAGGKKYIVK